MNGAFFPDVPIGSGKQLGPNERSCYGALMHENLSDLNSRSSEGATRGRVRTRASRRGAVANSAADFLKGQENFARLVGAL